ncbi:MAG: FAD-dependent oxidoreductase [Lachnospiraceae bacterium]|nr:FAD-dependent oxidoreductase [Lachnospiraceae bacterium]
MKQHAIVIIGGGPAGLAAAISAAEQGEKDILILERDRELGGILNQCIHNGFGLHTFQEELTGPEYAARYIEKVERMGIPYLTDTMVLDLSPEKVVTAVSPTEGIFQIQAQAVILAMGCRERPRGALNLPGYRPAGIYTAGTAQRLVNVEGRMPGREVVILGSGDIGLIMARRMTLEGAKVKVVAELMPYSGGLKRNIVQCLEDFGIPLKLSHTVVAIHGKERLTGVTLAQVDHDGRPVPGTEEEYSCDTLLLSVGLIPENELSKNAGVSLNPATSGPVVDESFQTSVGGIFACGNVLHVHDLVDFVSEEATNAGRRAAEYARETSEESSEKRMKCGESRKDLPESQAACEEWTAKMPENEVSGILDILPGDGVRYTVPSVLHLAQMGETLKIRFRVRKEYKNSCVTVHAGDRQLFRRRKQIFVPGEMEEAVIKREDLNDALPADTITVRIEEV